MTDRFPASHADHDPLLIAALAAGDLAPARREEALVLASACRDCALLEADLRAIAAATAALPAPIRRRDFSLSAGDAARLRTRGWRGVVRLLAGPRSAALKPLATGLTTLGIAGLLLAALPAIQLGSSAGGPTGAAASAVASEERETDSDTNYLAPAARTAPVRQAAGPLESALPQDSLPAARPVASPLGADEDTGDAGPGLGGGLPRAEPESAAPVGPAASPLALLSWGFLAAGLFLFGIRWAARRLSAG